MKKILLISLLISSCASNTDRLDDLFSGKGKVIDLTHSLSASSPFWPSDDGIPFDYDTLAAQKSGRPSMGRYSVSEHFGTHLDAPIHFADNLKSVDELTAGDLFGKAVVVNVVAKCEANPDYLLSLEDLQTWEKKHGRIPDHAVVIMYSGWCLKWNDMKSYRNADASGKMHFPGFSEEAAQWLVNERSIIGIGIDNMSVDAGARDGFPAHAIVNGAGKFHLENLANVDQMPESGAYLIVAPIKIEGGSGGQVRVYAVGS